jgi:hypothetical protein
MKKQELIHLHGLLAEVQEEVQAHTDMSIELDEYSSLSTRPTSIHKSKTDHKNAVFALASGITKGIETDSEEKIPAAD